MDDLLKTQYPKPSASRRANQPPLEPNPDIPLEDRKASWDECVSGSISFIEGLIVNLFGEEGLFSEKYHEEWLPFYMMDVFNVKDWIGIVGWSEMERLVKNDRKLMGKIRSVFLPAIDTQITALLTFINDANIPALRFLIDIRPRTFKNQLTLLIADALKKYVHGWKGQPAASMSAEQLMHRALYEPSTHDELGEMKKLVDVGWHWQPYEEYAETVAKITGIKYNDKSMRLTFDKLQLAVLDSMWLPSLADQKNLVKDVVLQAMADGVDCDKGSRSKTGILAFESLEKASELMAIPYN